METNFTAHVEGLTPDEVMQSMRRMMRKPYLILWAVVYTIALVVFLVKGSLSLWGWIGPAVILMLLALAYEFSGRKNFGPMKYGEAVLDYEFSPQGYRLTVGEQSVFFHWEDATLKRTRSDFLLYSDKHNSSILPLRCLTEAQKQQITVWAKAEKGGSAS